MKLSMSTNIVKNYWTYIKKLQHYMLKFVLLSLWHDSQYSSLLQNNRSNTPLRFPILKCRKRIDILDYKLYLNNNLGIQSNKWTKN